MFFHSIGSSAKQGNPIKTLFLTRANLTWMGAIWSNLSQPVAILRVYSACQAQRGWENNWSQPWFPKNVRDILYFFSEMLNIRPTINQIVRTGTIKPIPKFTLKNYLSKGHTELEIIMTLSFEGYWFLQRMSRPLLCNFHFSITANNSEMILFLRII